MTISKRPKSNHMDIKTIDKELAAESFISKTEQIVNKQIRQNKIPIMLRFDRDLLAQIDISAKKRGVSRSSWIHFILSKSLEKGEI